ncbi:hypothetical protein PEX1_038840 [Penicillium expansum]|nr:hypothetical protein PEXP_092890 [Penicillium expansum]KGO60466.1 hypothetical protein PEX1_038840 [Penicillium expansum]
MYPLGIFIASSNFTQAATFSAGLHRFVVGCSLVIASAERFWDQWSTNILQWLSRPDILAAITAWWITFTLVMALLMFLGFGPVGIVAGLLCQFLWSLAAGFQSFMYGGFTPAGGIFATLTSMAMLGTLTPPGVLVASILATGVAVVVWKVAS